MGLRGDCNRMTIRKLFLNCLGVIAWYRFVADQPEFTFACTCRTATTVWQGTLSRYALTDQYIHGNVR
jgi:hypothetical protein